jgi:hypothetical protein
MHAAGERPAACRDAGARRLVPPWDAGVAAPHPCCAISLNSRGSTAARVLPVSLILTAEPLIETQSLMKITAWARTWFTRCAACR